MYTQTCPIISAGERRDIGYGPIRNPQFFLTFQPIRYAAPGQLSFT
jgi:hypothetical protein